MSNTTCILCAMKTEAKPFLEALEEVTVSKYGRLSVCEGLLDGERVLLAYGAIGVEKAAAAARLLIERSTPQCLIMSGTAGGIDNNLEIGDTVVALETVYHDRDNEELFAADDNLIKRCQRGLEEHPPPHPVSFGRIATGKDFVKKSQRASIIRRLNPAGVDMESAAVAEVCKDQGVPFLAIRSISDTEAKAGFVVFFKNALFASRHSFVVTRTLLQSR